MSRTLPHESVSDHADFRRLAGVSNIEVDLRYASSNNFVGRDLYSPLDCGWLHRHAAQALENAVARLASERADLKLLVLDALRPQRVQQQLWNALQGTDFRQYLAPPERGSIHSFGMAVDVTLVDRQGRELDMGTGFDEFSERSHPARETALLARGELTARQVDHRRLLRETMRQAGWVGINSEWWHFDCGDRNVVRAEYTRIL